MSDEERLGVIEVTAGVLELPVITEVSSMVDERSTVDEVSGAFVEMLAEAEGPDNVLPDTIADPVEAVELLARPDPG